MTGRTGSARAAQPVGTARSDPSPGGMRWPASATAISKTTSEDACGGWDWNARWSTQDVYARTVERFREAGIVMPTFAQLADPSTIPAETRRRVAEVDPDAAPSAATSSASTGTTTLDEAEPVALPAHVVLPPELTGVPSPIVVLLGDRFPMIRSHKVLAAYGCLAPRIVTGQFDPASQRAVWPSTGNYCRGGVAISRIMGAAAWRCCRRA